MKRIVATSSLLLAIGACVDVNNYVNEQPPPSSGFNPGTGDASPGYGYGASGPGTNNPDDEAPPVECDDAFKRCPTPFTLAFGGETSVEVRGDFAPGAWESGIPMMRDGDRWAADVPVPWDGRVLYKFFVDGTTWISDPGNPTTESDGLGGLNSVFAPVTCGEDFICDPAFVGDFDWRDAVLYFVFVDRFLDGDPSNNATVPGVPEIANYQGGDWAGVIQRIDEGYFDDLGVNALWLSVPMENTDALGPGNDGNVYSAYHGYWPTDLTRTESRFGTMAELQTLVEKAHERDIKVVIDYAMNHVHADSPIYRDNPGWFWPNDNGRGGNCVCGEGCSWDTLPDTERCWFTGYLPDFNFEVPAAREFSVDNAVQWIKDTNIDGFRLDAVKHINQQWLFDLRSRIQSEIVSETEQHFYMVGETYTGDRPTIAKYVDPLTQLDGQFDFPLRAEIVSKVLMRNGSMQDLASFMDGNDTYYGIGIMSTFIGNHDLGRVIHWAEDSPLWGNEWDNGKNVAWSNQPGLVPERSAYERMANGFTLIYTIPGVPLVYYGDEVGLPGGGDPDNRRFMQWSNYSAGQNYLKEHLAELGRIRAAHPALRRGRRATVFTSADVYAYSMTGEGERVITIINRADSAQSANNVPDGDWTDALDGSTHRGGSVSVPARSARILVQGD